MVTYFPQHVWISFQWEQIHLNSIHIETWTYWKHKNFTCNRYHAYWLTNNLCDCFPWFHYNSIPLKLTIDKKILKIWYSYLFSFAVDAISWMHMLFEATVIVVNFRMLRICRCEIWPEIFCIITDTGTTAALGYIQWNSDKSDVGGCSKLLSPWGMWQKIAV